MKNKKWSREFPGVPETVHQPVLHTLSCLKDQEDKIMKKQNAKKKQTRRTGRRTILILAAAMAAALGMSAAASGIFQWNEQAQEVFEAGTKTQEKLVLENIASEEYQTVTDNGLTIRAIQTIQDSHCFYGLFEITVDDGSMTLDENCSMDYTMEFPNGEDPFIALGWHFVAEEEQEVSNRRYFEIFGTKMRAEEYLAVYGKEKDEQELNMNITFTTLHGPGEKATDGDVLAEGSWPFSLTIHPAQSVCRELNRTVTVNDCEIVVQSVELSPISMVLTCEEAGIRELEQKEGIDLDQLDGLQSMMVWGRI